jgi:predicted RNase H-like HicB family nuclease
MNKKFLVVIEKDEDGVLVAKVPDIPGCYTQANSMEELMIRIKEAIEVCLESSDDKIVPLDFVGLQQISISA